MEKLIFIIYSAFYFSQTDAVLNTVVPGEHFSLPTIEYQYQPYNYFGRTIALGDTYLVASSFRSGQVTMYQPKRASQVIFFKRSDVDIVGDFAISAEYTGCSADPQQDPEEYFFAGPYQAFNYSAENDNENIIGVAIGGNRAAATSKIWTDIYDYDSNTDTWAKTARIAYGSPVQNLYVPDKVVDLSEDGNTIVIGNVYHSSDPQYKGGFKVYKFDGTSWIQKLSVANNQAAKKLGQRVAISGDGLVVGACGFGANSGVSPEWYDTTLFNTYNPFCFIYTSTDGNTYTLAQTLYHSNSLHTTRPNFGSSIEFNYDGSLMFVGHAGYYGTCVSGCLLNGCSTECTDEVKKGSVYIYERNGATWDYAQELTYGDGQLAQSGIDANFGSSLSYDDNNLVIGAIRASNNGVNLCGSTGLFYHSGSDSTFYYHGELSTNCDAARYGYSVSINGRSAIAGGPYNQIRFYDPRTPEDGGTSGCLNQAINGAIQSWDDLPLPPTSSPTLSPTTSSPTLSPTVPAIQKRAEVKVKVSDTSSAKLKQTFTDSIANLKNAAGFSDFDNSSSTFALFRAKGKETVIFHNFDTLNSSSGLNELAILNSMGISPNDATVQFESTGSGRMLQSTPTTIVTVTYDLSDLQYLNISSLDDSNFLTSLATQLGVNVNDIDVDTNTVSEVTISIELYAGSTSSSQPLGEDVLNSITTIQSELTNITTSVATTLGISASSIESPTLDLCSQITCTSANTIIDQPYTDANGCIVDVGKCNCKDGYWGIDCGTACVCNNNSVDNSITLCLGGKCQCQWPDYGVNCEHQVVCSC